MAAIGTLKHWRQNIISSNDDFCLLWVEIIVGKGEMLVNRIFSFSNNVFKGFLKTMKGQGAVKRGSPFPKKALLFTCLNKSFQKTGEKKKLLVTSVFLRFWELSAIFIKFEIVCKFFQFGRI